MVGDFQLLNKIQNIVNKEPTLISENAITRWKKLDILDIKKLINEDIIKIDNSNKINPERREKLLNITSGFLIFLCISM